MVMYFNLQQIRAKLINLGIPQVLIYQRGYADTDRFRKNTTKSSSLAVHTENTPLSNFFCLNLILRVGIPYVPMGFWWLPQEKEPCFGTLKAWNSLDYRSFLPYIGRRSSCDQMHYAISTLEMQCCVIIINLQRQGNIAFAGDRCKGCSRQDILNVHLLYFNVFLRHENRALI